MWVFSSIWYHGLVGTERSVSNQHALEHDDRGTLGVRQDGVHDQIIAGQSRSVRDTPSKNLLLLRGVARRIPTFEETRGQVSRRYPRFRIVTRAVSQRRITGVGRSDGRRGQRQTGLGSLHETFASSERDGRLLVSRHVSTRQVRQEHLLQCPLHRGLQESPRSIGDA